MSLLLPEIQAKAGNLSEWASHIDEPFSAVSLADRHKPYITVGHFPFPDSMCEYDRPDEDWFIEETVKEIGDPDITLRCLSNVCARRAESGWCSKKSRMSDHLAGFQLAAGYLLGQERFVESSVDLTLWREPVEAGIGQVTKWHLDIKVENDERKLVGLNSDVLVTQILLNPTKPDDYEFGILTSIMGVPLDRISEEDLLIETLPANTLTVMPTSLPHRGQTAASYIAQRHFSRLWANSPV